VNFQDAENNEVHTVVHVQGYTEESATTGTPLARTVHVDGTDTLEHVANAADKTDTPVHIASAPDRTATHEYAANAASSVVQAKADVQEIADRTATPVHAATSIVPDNADRSTASSAV